MKTRALHTGQMWNLQVNSKAWGIRWRSWQLRTPSAPAFTAKDLDLACFSQIFRARDQSGWASPFLSCQMTKEGSNKIAVHKKGAEWKFYSHPRAFCFHILTLLSQTSGRPIISVISCVRPCSLWTSFHGFLHFYHSVSKKSPMATADHVLRIAFLLSVRCIFR